MEILIRVRHRALFSLEESMYRNVSVEYNRQNNTVKFRDKAIKLIRLYKRDIDKEYCRLSLKRDLYQKYSAMWAINDLLEYVMANPNSPVILAVEAYARKMDRFSCKKSPYSYVFSVANDVAVGVLDMLYSRL